MESDETVVPGLEFGPYRLLALLGRGGMGEVWRAFDTRRERTVALKRMTSHRDDDEQFRQRFRREARLTARLASGHVIPIHDFGEIDGILFVDMRLVDGLDLGQLLARHESGLDTERAVTIVGQLAAALDAAHAAGLVHRDVKPSNVLIESGDGSREFVYLVDFGIASSIDASRLTATGSTLGTPAYMAPELFGADGPGAASTVSDVYALGCVFFEMLTGRSAFSGPSVSMIGQHLYRPPPLPSEHRPELAIFDGLVATALSKEPTGRQRSAGALAAAARRAQDSGRAATGTRAVPDGSGAAGTPGRSRRRALVVAAAAVVLLAVVVAAVLLASAASTESSATGGALQAPDVAPQALQLPDGLATSGDVAASRDGAALYALKASRDGALAMVDAARGGVRAVVPVGAFPNALDVSPDGSTVYVANYGENGSPGSTVSVVDTVNARITATVTVGLFPLGLVVSPDGSRVYVTNAGTTRQPGGTVSVIDTTTDAVITTVPVGRSPTNPVVSPDGRSVYVPNVGTDAKPETTVSVLDATTNTVTRTLQVGSKPRSVAVSPDGRRLYVVAAGTTTPGPGGAGQGAIYVTDLASGTSTTLAPTVVTKPHDIAISPDGTTLAVSEIGNPRGGGEEANPLLFLDSASGSVRRSFVLGGAPKRASFTRDGRSVIVATTSPGDLWHVPLS